MSISKTNEQIKSYLVNLKNDKLELVKIISLFLFAIYLTFKFLGSFDSTLGYDMRGEFSGYLIILSFFSFLFIKLKSEKPEFILCLSFSSVMISLLNFLIIKSLSTLWLLKLLCLFLAILLLLVTLREIAKR